MKSIEQMTKKERKEYYKKFRGDWGSVNPVTKTTKKYKGKRKVKGGVDEESRSYTLLA